MLSASLTWDSHLEASSLLSQRSMLEEGSLQASTSLTKLSWRGRPLRGRQRGKEKTGWIEGLFCGVFHSLPGVSGELAVFLMNSFWCVFLMFHTFQPTPVKGYACARESELLVVRGSENLA